MANTTKEPTELRELEVDEISLVKQGANRKRFKILKEDGAPVLVDEVIMETPEIPYADILKADLGIEDTLRDTLKQTPELSTDATEAMVGIVKLATAYAEQLPSDIFDTLAEASGFEKAETKKAFPFEKPPVKPAEETPEEKIKRLEEEAAAQKKQGSKKMEKSEESDPVKVALDKITKEADIDLLPEDIQGAVRPLWKANVELEQKVQKMEDDARTKEFIAKAAEYTHLPKTDSFATLLKEMNASLSPESYTAIEGILKSADNGLKESGLFAEVGSEAAITGTPEGRLAALAKERVEKSDGKLTFAQAMSDVTMEHPDVYEDMLKQRGNR
jgi:hypothetical protein